MREMNSIELNIKAALEDASLPFYPGREYKLVKPNRVKTRESQGWKSLAFYSSRPEEPMVIMEKENE
jgi:hypothetical protein